VRLYSIVESLAGQLLGETGSILGWGLVGTDCQECVEPGDLLKATEELCFFFFFFFLFFFLFPSFKPGCLVLERTWVAEGV
jgi:hypothetical protein